MEEQTFQKLVLEKLDSFEHKFEGLEGRFDTLEYQVDAIAREVVNIKDELADKPSRQEMNEKFDAHMNVMDTYVRLHTKLDQEVTMCRHANARLEKRVEKIESQI